MANSYSESEKDFARQVFVDFDDEVSHWRENYSASRFYREGLDFRDFEPSVRLGINAFLRSQGRSFNEVKVQLADSYERTRGITPLDWSEASIAAEAAWNRMDERLASRMSSNTARELRPPLPSSTRPARSSAKRRPATPTQ
ncbi:MAG: hypothetical protein H0W24_07190 [Lysobacter sp.]|nr:hypothetical protein [Lysobacter sp.]MDQ3269502.1 hypothetical protein [Pseudomonadota bacterium]